MPLRDPHISAAIVELLSTLAGDWEYSGEIAEDTRFIHDLGMESLDLVVLGTSIQERYGRLPFAEFLASIGERPVDERDITVGELVDFVIQHRTVAAGEA